MLETGAWAGTCQVGLEVVLGVRGEDWVGRRTAVWFGFNWNCLWAWVPGPMCLFYIQAMSSARHMYLLYMSMYFDIQVPCIYSMYLLGTEAMFSVMSPGPRYLLYIHMNSRVVCRGAHSCVPKIETRSM